MNEQLFGKKVINSLSMLVIILCAFFFVRTIQEVKRFGFIEGEFPPGATISVSGEGEVFAVPTTGEFSYAVRHEAKTVAEAQQKTTEISNSAIAYLKAQGIEEKDIKTVSYNVNPRYEYQPRMLYPCTEYGCPPDGKSVLAGYEVTQTVSVKVRNVEEVGKLLGGLGELGVTDVSSLSFTVDDREVFEREARKLAIADAKEKARALSRDLGVRLIRITNFSESGNYPIYRLDTAEAYEIDGGAPPAPEIPVGETKIVSNVTITYEVR